VVEQQESSQESFEKLKLMDAFEPLEDPRRLKSCDYPLQELLLTALCAISAAADDWVEVALWGREKLDWLRRFLPFRNGIASHDTFSRVFALLDAEEFEACFIKWMERLCPSLRGHAIHVDGKSLRGSHNGIEAMAHLVSAWDSKVGVTLGQVKTADKSNEIIAVPQLLRLLDIRGVGEVQTECRFYISSHDFGAKQFNQGVRGHWSTENGQHWTLDVVFREEDSRIRVGHGAENFAIIRRMSLNLMNQNTTTATSKKCLRKMAAWNTEKLVPHAYRGTTAYSRYRSRRSADGPRKRRSVHSRSMD
jgi:predicted transposase YbfD/YdcC